MKRTVLAFGSNSSNAREIFSGALDMLARAGWSTRRLSSIITTAPVDCQPGTPDFQNAVCVGSWPGSAEELLDLTQSVERAFGRPANHRSDQARPLDIDIILFGEERITSARLTVPHPRARKRKFVTEPLREIAPELINLLL